MKPSGGWGLCILGVLSFATVVLAQEKNPNDAIQAISEDQVSAFAAETAALAANPNPARSSQNKNPITVLIYGSEDTFSVEMLGREIRFLENTYHLPVIALSALSGTELKADFAELGHTQMRIQNLIMRGVHGGSYQSVLGFEVQDYANDDFENVGFNELAKAAGGPLNFSPTAYVYLDSCDMIEKETVASIHTAMLDMNRIGFKTGWVYLNHDHGSYAAENMFTVPFYDARTTKDKVQRIAAQASWIVTLPVMIYLDYTRGNHGFMVGVSPNHELILKMHGHDAEKGQLDKGAIFSFQ